MRYCRRFLAGIPHQRAGHPRVTHPSATRSPSEESKLVRLACVRHAASVYPEPGSNSPFVFSGHPFSERIDLNDEQSQPNVALGCFAHVLNVLKLTETASANSCCSVFHSSIVKVRSSNILLDSTARNKGYLDLLQGG